MNIIKTFEGFSLIVESLKKGDKLICKHNHIGDKKISLTIDKEYTISKAYNNFFYVVLDNGDEEAFYITVDEDSSPKWIYTNFFIES